MVWARVEERLRRRREKDVRDGAAMKDEKQKAKEEVYGCGEGGHAGGGHDGGRCRGQGKMETDDLLWRPITGAAEKRRSSRSTETMFLYSLIFL